MPAPDSQRRLTPDFRVRINGAELPPAAAADVLRLDVLQDTHAPGRFTFRLVNWDMTRLKVTWADDPLFAVGGEVEVQMGYLDDLETVMVGEITGLEPEFTAGEIPTVTVSGYDRRHRLMRGRKTRSFIQVKDSDIAGQVAGDAGLTAEAQDTGMALDYVLQHNQTDLEFLQQRAGRIGYEVLIENKTLLFRPYKHDASARLTLTLDDGLLEFYPRLTTVGQVGEVDVRGWNLKDKAAIVGQAAAGDAATKMGGDTLGLAAADSAFGAARTARVDQPVRSQGEADRIALGRLEETALAYITGEGACVGRPDLAAGAVIKLDGLGTRFSGNYYVTSAAHSYSPRRGYRTAFSVRRNAT